MGYCTTASIVRGIYIKHEELMAYMGEYDIEVAYKMEDHIVELFSNKTRSDFATHMEWHMFMKDFARSNPFEVAICGHIEDDETDIIIYDVEYAYQLDSPKDISTVRFNWMITNFMRQIQEKIKIGEFGIWLYTHTR